MKKTQIEDWKSISSMAIPKGCETFVIELLEGSKDVVFKSLLGTDDNRLVLAGVFVFIPFDERMGYKIRQVLADSQIGVKSEDTGPFKDINEAISYGEEVLEGIKQDFEGYYINKCSRCMFAG